MKNQVYFATLLSCFVSASQAQTPIQVQPLQTSDQTVCQTFELAIENSIKNIAMFMADGFGESSAPRQTNRNIDINNQLLMINITLQLQTQNKCKLRQSPINPEVYATDAANCSYKKVAEKYGEMLPVCDKKNWKAVNK